MKKLIKQKLLEALMVKDENTPQKFLTVYHGTQPKFVELIKKNGLENNTGYDQGWYMVATDFQSALFHATPSDENDYAYVFEFKIPLEKNKYWDGYPYLWKGRKRSDESTWFALMQKLPKEFITDLKKITFDDWRKAKLNGL